MALTAPRVASLIEHELIESNEYVITSTFVLEQSNHKMIVIYIQFLVFFVFFDVNGIKENIRSIR